MEQAAARTAGEEQSAENQEKTISVEVVNCKTLSMPIYAKITDVLQASCYEPKYPVVAARINNRTKDLNTELYGDCTLEFVDMSTEEGMKVYHAGMIFVLARAATEILPGCSLAVMHSLGNAIYGEIKYKSFLKDVDMNKIEERMREIIDADEPIQRSTLPRSVAINLFREGINTKKKGLLEYFKSDTLDVVTCGTYTDYVLGPMVPSTGFLKTFRLRYYLPGFILEMPRRENPLELPEYIEQYKLANVLYETEKWARVLKVHDAVALNNIITSSNRSDLVRLIRVAEGFQEKRIVQIADQIASSIDRIRIVLIAGPSSSGKTTFTQRLAIQLRVNGITPVAISLDDYFVNRELTPLDESGEYDFESLDAIDRPLFNDHLIKLIQGEEVELPKYNFKIGQREYTGEKLKLGQHDLIVMEGIHGLNDKLTISVPKSRKFKIYVSALTHLSMDNLHRIHTTDLRLMRRIVRDNSYRGRSALDTLRQWQSVRRGEERNIFPFQESADVMFNSALVYELPVLKGYVEPLLQAITPDNPEYAEAKRLRNLLGFFVPMDSADVSFNSIIREFIGNSCFLN
jgi:uridine kinase